MTFFIIGHITEIYWLKPRYRQLGFPPAAQPSVNPAEQPGSKYWGSATLPVYIYVEVLVVVVLVVLVNDYVEFRLIDLLRALELIA